ncbi:N-formylglutamate amidohydrolase [Telmatospirillum sp.]|uniref:N-formylglutamate amidohydrolase n=1 Tax=Telmatospirillum sp. TaxID=2079197 RepID=UPI00283BE701|nr:N-formylglutamate amidohydrolase [Telmatospirillum sp.]MDR3436523.1 N-formylglutamate amidohydrolase [Telmatospirillum sp.]
MNIVRDFHFAALASEAVVTADEIPIFEVLSPERVSVPFLFNSPHSGRHYTEGFLSSSRLDRVSIRRSEDSYVDELFAGSLLSGAPMLRANFPRAFLDVNREPYELDPKMFRGRLPSYANIRSLRVAGGLGTIARVVAEHEEIYHSPLDVSDALDRIERIYKPYHAMLRKTLARLHVDFGFAVLIDCHSMPSVIRGIDPAHRPDFILGDRYGTSCSPDLTETAASILRSFGYTVSRNKPYAGGFITEHYGRPAKGLHALQIEINRGLYMHETTFEKSDAFDELVIDLSRFADEIVRATGVTYLPKSLAAE